MKNDLSGGCPERQIRMYAFLYPIQELTLKLSLSTALLGGRGLVLHTVHGRPSVSKIRCIPEFLAEYSLPTRIISIHLKKLKLMKTTEFNIIRQLAITLCICCLPYPDTPIALSSEKDVILGLGVICSKIS